MKADYRAILISQFEFRAKKKQPYSMSSFAKEVGLSKSRLHEVLSGKQGLSRISALKICKNLKLSPHETEHFCDLVTAKHGRSQVERNLARQKLSLKGMDKKINFVSKELAHVLKWYHLPILSLFEIKLGDLDLRIISEKLKISVQETKQAVTDLIELGGLVEEQHRLKLNPQRIENLQFSGNTPETTKALLLAMIDKSKLALQEKPSEERHIGSSVIALTKKDVVEFKTLITAFRRKIEDKAQNSKFKDSVYCLNVQFFEI